LVLALTLFAEAPRGTLVVGNIAYDGDAGGVAGDADHRCRPARFYYVGHDMQIAGTNFLLPVKTPFDTLAGIKLDSVNQGLTVAQSGGGSRGPPNEAGSTCCADTDGRRELSGT